MTRRRRVVRGRGAPRGAIALMRRAYLLVLKAAHEGALREHGLVQDAAKSPVKVPAEVLRLVERATRTIQASADEALQKIPGISAARVAGGENLVRAFRKRNVALIRTLAQEHLWAVTDVLAEAGNLHTKGLAEALHAVTEQYGISARRAEFWAVDQTLKLNANVVQAKHRSLGIVEYKWRTSRDSAVRETHAELEGRTFRYDDPPETGTGRHNPGEDYRCRCHGDPVLPVKEKPAPKPAQKIQKPTPIKAAPGGTWYPTPKSAKPPAPTPPVPVPTEAKPVPAEVQLKPLKSVAWRAPAATLTEAIAQLPPREQTPLLATKMPRTPEFEAKMQAGLDRIKQLDAELMARSGFTERSRQGAITAYTDQDYYQIRLAERVKTGQTFGNDLAIWDNIPGFQQAEYSAAADALAAAQDALKGHDRPHAGHTLYRGVRYEDSLVTDVLNGKEIRFGGSGSTSFSYRIAAEEFAHVSERSRSSWAVVFEISSHRGGIAIDKISANAGEQEVLFGRDARFRAVGVQRIEGAPRAILVQVEEI